MSFSLDWFLGPFNMKVASCRGDRLLMHFCRLGVCAAASKITFRPNWSVEGFGCSLIGCQPFRDRSRTGRGLIVNFVASNMQAAFPGQKKMLADARLPAAFCNFRHCRGIHPGSPLSITLQVLCL